MVSDDPQRRQSHEYVPSPQSQLRPSTAATVFSAAVMVVSGALPIALLAAFAVRIENTLGITDAQVGGALSTFFGVSVAFSIIAGRLADRLGPIRALALSAGLTLIALVGGAVLAQSYPALLACYAVGGVGQAVAAPTSNVILAAGVRHERIGLAMGFKQAAVPLASLMSGVAVSLTASSVSWRWSFAAAAAIPAIAMASITRNRPVGALTSASTADGRAREDVHRMWPYAVAGGMSTFCASAITGFVVLGLVDAGYAESAAGLVLTTAGVCAIGVRVASGLLRDRLQFSSVRAVVVLLLFGAVGFVMLVTSIRFLVPVGAVIAYGAGWGWPAMFHLTLVERHPTAPGAATGVARVGLAGGNSLGPLFFGVVFTSFGYRIGWIVAGFGMLVSAMLMRHAGRSAQRTPQAAR